MVGSDLNSVEWVAVIGALVVSFVVPIAAKPVLSGLHVVDVPNVRSSHARPVLRGLGIAPLLGFITGIVIVLLSATPLKGNQQLFVVVLSGMAVGLIGLVEDIRGVRIVVRASLQLLIGAGATSALVTISDAGWWWIPVGAFAFTAYTNAANFMDGINGISGLHGAVVGIAFALIGVLLDVSWLVPAGLVLAASFVAFLPWNLAHGGAFLGDVGSYLLGGGVGIIGIAAVMGGVPVLAFVGPVAIYLADTGITLLRRILRGEQWQQAHRLHVYQRLTDSGLSHIAVALIVTVATLAATAFGLLSTVGTAAGTLIAAIGLACVAALYLTLPRLRLAVLGPQTDPKMTLELPDSDLPARISAHTAARWAVIGASGFIGSAVTAELENRGFDVVYITAPRLLLSPSATTEEVLAQARVAKDSIASVAEMLAGVDVVINAAGLASPNSTANNALFGANSLLPAVILHAAERSQVARVIHLSSAAVQGRRAVLDESAATSPFSPYSKSKALGEATLLAYVATVPSTQSPEVVIVRATSVQGPVRETTQKLQQFARSPLSSVAWPGTRPTVVSSLRGLVEFLVSVGAFTSSVPTVVLQPWEGMTTSAVLESAGGRVPLKVPAALCRVLVALGYMVASLAMPLNGFVRRVEMMWLGQDQDAGWARSVGLEHSSYVAGVFEESQGRGFE